MSKKVLIDYTLLENLMIQSKFAKLRNDSVAWLALDVDVGKAAVKIMEDYEGPRIDDAINEGKQLAKSIAEG